MGIQTQHWMRRRCVMAGQWWRRCPQPI